MSSSQVPSSSAPYSISMMNNPGNRPHLDWEPIVTHTAKCDSCTTHNTSILMRCHGCQKQYCRPHFHTANYDGKHPTDADTLDWDPSHVPKQTHSSSNPKSKPKPKQESPTPAGRKVVLGSRVNKTPKTPRIKSKAVREALESEDVEEEPEEDEVRSEYQGNARPDLARERQYTQRRAELAEEEHDDWSRTAYRGNARPELAQKRPQTQPRQGPEEKEQDEGEVRSEYWGNARPELARKRRHIQRREHPVNKQNNEGRLEYRGSARPDLTQQRGRPRRREELVGEKLNAGRTKYKGNARPDLSRIRRGQEVREVPERMSATKILKKTGTRDIRSIRRTNYDDAQDDEYDAGEDDRHHSYPSIVQSSRNIEHGSPRYQNQLRPHAVPTRSQCIEQAHFTSSPSTQYNDDDSPVPQKHARAYDSSTHAQDPGTQRPSRPYLTQDEIARATRTLAGTSTYDEAIQAAASALQGRSKLAADLQAVDEYCDAESKNNQPLQDMYASGDVADVRVLEKAARDVLWMARDLGGLLGASQL